MKIKKVGPRGGPRVFNSPSLDPPLESVICLVGIIGSVGFEVADWIFLDIYDLNIISINYYSENLYKQ